MHVRSLIESILSPSDAEKFAEWAWGKNYRTINLTSKESVDIWNGLHSNDLILDVKNSPSDDIPKMINIWLKYEN